ncbi:hypothetical protein TSOC_003618 [Tetrabaena socialis]|uniref:Reverse transcriptase domain-containing protein n=1 Tax=Tetrabaena socialis TaxID=47790 RepID=A0A2J8AB65_9CHLO|nr:hypothetical protein TSOC_003618 [Tetrabaena socialis]|eukprot:PNH09713.1 hypothetical protein TSOC_003618 [Tetrabaena socialis]
MAAHYQHHNALLAPWLLLYHVALPPAYYAGTLKMHKRPPAMRFLACSHSCPSSYIGDLNTAILRVLAAEFVEVWRAKLPNNHPWLCLSTAAVINMVHAYNTRNYLPTSSESCLPQAYDFARLYTNIPHDSPDGCPGLVDTFRELVDTCLDPLKYSGIQVDSIDPNPEKPHQRTTHTAKFVPAGEAPLWTHKDIGTTGRHSRRFFTSAAYMEVFQSLVACTFIQFGHNYVRQVKGIPMGISPAPFIANLFLCWFEFKFMQQRLKPSLNHNEKTILRPFTFSCRFLDDLCCFRNRSLESLLYTNQHIDTLHGIYPPYLRVERQHHADLPREHLPFLDVLLKHGERDGKCHIRTVLYDKRDQRVFGGIRLSRFVPRCSSVNEAAKRNIFSGQFHRLRRIITDPENFCFSMARIMTDLMRQGYTRNALEVKYRDLLRAFPQLFYFERKPANGGLDIFARTASHVARHLRRHKADVLPAGL